MTEVQGSGGQLERPLEACLQPAWTCSDWWGRGGGRGAERVGVSVSVSVRARALSHSVKFKPILKQSFVFQVLVVNRN